MLANDFAHGVGDDGHQGMLAVGHGGVGRVQILVGRPFGEAVGEEIDDAGVAGETAVR